MLASQHKVLRCLDDARDMSFRLVVGRKGRLWRVVGWSDEME